MKIFRHNWRKIHARACRLFKGFGTPPPHPTIKKLEYVPGFLPTPEEWEQLGRPKIVFPAGTRRVGFREAVEKGWKFVLDSSAPGLGKSHEAGLLNIEEQDMRSHMVNERLTPEPHNSNSRSQFHGYASQKRWTGDRSIPTNGNGEPTYEMAQRW